MRGSQKEPKNTKKSITYLAPEEIALKKMRRYQSQKSFIVRKQDSKTKNDLLGNLRRCSELRVDQRETNAAQD